MCVTVYAELGFCHWMPLRVRHLLWLQAIGYDCDVLRHFRFEVKHNDVKHMLLKPFNLFLIEHFFQKVSETIVFNMDSF